MTNTVLVIAMTIWLEARGEPLAGQYAVASVIHNRAHGNKAAFASVCLAPKQFSCWNRSRIKVDSTDKVFLRCVRIAESMVSGTFIPTISATHYHATSVRPSWAKKLIHILTYGKHKFYRKAA